MRRLRVRTAVVSVVALLAGLALPGLDPAGAAKPPSGGGGSGTGISVVDYAQCANGAPPSVSTACPSGWINGILNANNSHYAEDQVVPQRMVFTVPAGSPASGRTLTIEYMTRKGSTHAYDSLATWNYTQHTAQRCQGLSNANCPGGPVSTFPMQTDLTPVPPTGPGIPAVTSAHELTEPSPQGIPPRQWEMYGGQITAASAPVHTNAAGTGDDNASVTVTYRVTDSNNDGKADAATKVQLLFGGHLAASSGPRSWGTGLGSANISGGPYHIKWIAADGASVGNRDNQIQSSAIIAGAPAITVDKSANTGTAEPGTPVVYRIVATNNGTASGTKTFEDDYDDRLSVTPPAGCVDSSTATNEKMTCTTGTLAPGANQVFEYTVIMPEILTGTSGTPCPPGQFAIINNIRIDGVVTDTVTVCVPAAPDFVHTKLASKTTAVPGEAITYTITVRNEGSVAGSETFIDDYDNRLTFPLPAGCVAANTGSGNNVNKRMSCTTGVIQPGGEQVFQYTVNMPSTFAGNAPKCGDGVTFLVYNQVLVNGVKVAEESVCVDARPAFIPSKTATPNPADAGALVTYTLRITNNGTAAGVGTGVDDYDDRLTVVPPPGCVDSSTATNEQMTCTTGVLEPGAHQDFVYTATMPDSFDTPPNPSNAAECPGRHTVTNRFTVGTSTATHHECVTADPHFTPPTKTANPTTSSPGGSVQFTISTTNDGDAPGSVTLTDVYDVGVTITVVPAGCTNNPATRTLTCTATNVLPGDDATFVYTATMPTTFTGTPGAGECDDDEYPVINTVTIVGQPPTSEVVCVPAPPILAIAKAANSTGSTFNDLVTYTLTYSNSGAGEAAVVTIDEEIPAGTAFVSCTGGCTISGTPTSNARWQVGPLSPGESDSVTITVRVTSRVACEICNTATISSPQVNGGTPVPSNRVCVPNSPTPDPAGAHASGNAFGVLADVGGLLNLDVGPTQYVETSQSGPGGPVIDSDVLATVAVPGSPLLGIGSGGIVRAEVLPTSSSSEVDGASFEANSTDQAEVAHVCVLDTLLGPCLVEAGTLRAVASATATGDSASTSTAGTSVQYVNVLGSQIGDPQTGVVAPNTVIQLDPVVFGAGSYVAVNEQIASTSTAGPNVADIEVNLIRVHVTNVLLGLSLVSVDVIVGHAEAHADFPKTVICQTQPLRSVSGRAMVASVDTQPSLVTPTVGLLVLPSNGGSREFNAVSAQVLSPTLVQLVRLSASTSSTAGTITPTQSRADSHAAVSGNPTPGVCILPSNGSCLVGATLVRTDAHAVANASGATANDAGSQLVGLTIAGNTITLPVPNNTVIPIPGVATVIINERFCDAGSTLNATATTCTGTTHAGITGRSLHIILGKPLLGLPIGAEIIVAEAHADATFGGV